MNAARTNTSIRLTPEVADSLSRLSERLALGGTGRTVEYLCNQLSAVQHIAASEFPLQLAEANLLADISNGTLATPGRFGSLLAGNLQDTVAQSVVFSSADLTASYSEQHGLISSQLAALIDDLSAINPAADWAIADALSQWWDAGPQTERERLDTYVECGLSIIAPLIADFAMTDAVTVLRGCRLRAGQFTLHELGDHISSLPGSDKLVLEYVDPEPVFGEIEPPASRLTRQPDRDSVLPTHAPGTSPESNEGLRQVAAVLCNLRWNRQRSQAGPWEWALMKPVELRPSPSMAPLWELA